MSASPTGHMGGQPGGGRSGRTILLVLGLCSIACVLTCAGCRVRWGETHVEHETGLGTSVLRLESRPDKKDGFVFGSREYWIVAADSAIKNSDWFVGLHWPDSVVGYSANDGSFAALRLRWDYIGMTRWYVWDANKRELKEFWGGFAGSDYHRRLKDSHPDLEGD